MYLLETVNVLFDKKNQTSYVGLFCCRKTPLMYFQINVYNCIVSRIFKHCTFKSRVIDIRVCFLTRGTSSFRHARMLGMQLSTVVVYLQNFRSYKADVTKKLKHKQDVIIIAAIIKPPKRTRPSLGVGMMTHMGQTLQKDLMLDYFYF